jgi:hypothetical protein
MRFNTGLLFVPLASCSAAIRSLDIGWHQLAQAEPLGGVMIKPLIRSYGAMEIVRREIAKEISPISSNHIDI